MANPTDDPTGIIPPSTEATIDGIASTPDDTDSEDKQNAAAMDNLPEDSSEGFGDDASFVNTTNTADNGTNLMEPVDTEDILHNIVSDRAAEVPALLDSIGIPQHEEPKTASAMDSFHDIPDNLPISATTIEPGDIAARHPDNRAELKTILESLQESLDNTQYISSKMDAVSTHTERLVNQTNNILSICELLTAEMESLSSGASTKSILSKTFLIASSTAIALLLLFQVYTFTSLIKIQRTQNATGLSIAENVSHLNKQMAAYNNTLTKALENSVQQAHAQPNSVAPEKPGHEDPGKINDGSPNAMAVLEKMNKLRNGLPEKKIIRKETGDWFIFNKKAEECIADAEVVEVLNQAYKKIGRSLSPGIPMPSHKALCILKPDGKGGTEVVMSKTFLP